MTMGVIYSGSTHVGRAACAAMIEQHIELTNTSVFSIFEPLATLSPGRQKAYTAQFDGFEFLNATCEDDLILNFDDKTCCMYIYYLFMLH